MDEMIGYCGYNCHLCAAWSEDPAVRQRLVDGWRKIFGHENYTAENVKCDGCRSDGRVADQQCKARPCARERGVESMPNLMATLVRAGKLPSWLK